MEANTELLIGLGLFVASELIGLNPKWRANSVLQLVVGAAIRAFPYEPGRAKAKGPLDTFLGRRPRR